MMVQRAPVLFLQLLCYSDHTAKSLIYISLIPGRGESLLLLLLLLRLSLWIK